MKYVYSAYVAQREVSHSYDKGVPKNTTYRTHSYQHKYQQELESLKLGLGLFWSGVWFLKIRLLTSLKLCYKIWQQFSKRADGFMYPAETLRRCLLTLGWGKKKRCRTPSSWEFKFQSSHPLILFWNFCLTQVLSYERQMILYVQGWSYPFPFLSVNVLYLHVQLFSDLPEIKIFQV